MKWKAVGLAVVIGVAMSCARDPGGLSEAVEDIEAGHGTTPLIEQPAQGQRANVTFLVQSSEEQPPRIVSDVTGWGESPDDSFFDTTIGTMTRVGSSGWYRLDTQVAPHSRIEYLVVHGEDGYQMDPNNPRRAWSRGGHEVSEFVTPDYQPPEELAGPPTTPPGRTIEVTIDSPALGAPRRALAYLPPGYRDDVAYPVAVFHSGWGVAHEGQAPRILDWLIAQREIEPVVGFFLESRLAGDSDNHQGPPMRAFLTEEAPSVLATLFRVAQPADGWAILAISYGAKDAVDAALAPTATYDRLGLLIPGRRLTPTDLEAFAEQSERGLRVAILAGLYDQANLATAKDAHRTLTDAGHTVDFIEVPEGHNSTTWRDHLGDVLVSLFGARDRSDGEVEAEDGSTP